MAPNQQCTRERAPHSGFHRETNHVWELTEWIWGSEVRKALKRKVAILLAGAEGKHQWSMAQSSYASHGSDKDTPLTYASWELEGSLMKLHAHRCWPQLLPLAQGERHSQLTGVFHHSTAAKASCRLWTVRLSHVSLVLPLSSQGWGLHRAVTNYLIHSWMPSTQTSV